jgi:uncharacterized 2Fe-2S/4Fe-4S cluster protein (DUF4445 family)
MIEQEKKDIPLLIAVSVAAKEPNLSDNTADIDRLCEAVKKNLPRSLENRKVTIPFLAMGSVAVGFRKAGFSGRALLSVLEERLELIDFVAGSGGGLFAVALDLGTTHLEATLIDLEKRENVGHANRVNRQVEYGTDILTRIHLATSQHGDQDGRILLQRAVVDSINGLIHDLAAQVDTPNSSIRGICVSGNTTMVHLLLGLSPYHLCREPYIPLVNAPDPFHARHLGFDIHPLSMVWILPSIGSYFGGDLISGIIASGLDKMERTCMLIDVGTNAEVVLGNRDWLIACAGAAGPALEGGVAKMGMRAAPGAIERVSLNREKWLLEVQTIDGEPAVGICGSGLIDLVAELYLAEIVDMRGKLCRDLQTGTKARRDFIRSRLRAGEEGLEFIVVAREKAGGEAAVVLAQTDLDAMMRSKAAMYAILTTLTGQVGVEFSGLWRIFIAGAFGKHIDPEKAVTLGMLPDLDMSIYQPIGNSSLHGAELMVLSERVRERSLIISSKITYIELNVNQEFMICFSGSRFIPHTDPQLFPSVPSFR